MKSVVAFLMLLGLSCMQIFGQESIKKDTIKLGTGLKKDVGGEFLLIDSSTDRVKIKDHEVNQEIQSDSSVDFDFRQERPFYVPIYYVNPSPMFMGDYNAFGQFSPYFYGRGMQTTIPGIGRVNQMMFIYQREINDFLDIYAGVNAAKYTFPYSVGQSFGVSGGMTLHPADDFHLTVFGAYSPDNRYNLNRTYYGVTVGYDFTNRFGVDVGVQRYYDVRQGWKTAPMVVPSYKFRKFKLGIDVGGLFYEAVRSAIDR